MKIIKPGHPKKHWIYGVTITCDRCDAQYQVEKGTDFSGVLGPNEVKTVCPCCDHYQVTHKPRREKNIVPSAAWIQP